MFIVPNGFADTVKMNKKLQVCAGIYVHTLLNSKFHVNIYAAIGNYRDENYDTCFCTYHAVLTLPSMRMHRLDQLAELISKRTFIVITLLGTYSM